MMQREGRIAGLYRRWARLEARGRSELYEEVSEFIADDSRLLSFLAALPAEKSQPNLFLAAVRYLYGAVGSPEEFRDLVLQHPDQIATVMRDRTTQTNQPARCATLLPALARLDGPLALLEVGASAGLCLLPDRYDYTFTTPVDGDPAETAVRSRVDRRPGPWPEPPRFSCRVTDVTPVPAGPIEVVWRAGLDVDPVDVADADARAWLDALIWPGEEELRANLHRAIAVAAADPPPVHRGDLRADLLNLAEQAPGEATLVVFHTAVLAYVTDADERQKFVDQLRRTGRHRRLVWLANETPTRIPGVPDELVRNHPLGDFLLTQNGRAVARTDPHGTYLSWLAPPTT